MKSKLSYLDFAEDDYKYHYENIQRGVVSNAIASGSQNTCERYLKHILENGWIPQNKQESEDKEDILYAHSLKKLVRKVEAKTNVRFTKKEKDAINSIDGFYFTTRYPGEDSFMASRDDMKDCKRALDVCRDKALEFCRNQEKELEKQKKDEKEKSISQRSMFSRHSQPVPKPSIDDMLKAAIAECKSDTQRVKEDPDHTVSHEKGNGKDRDDDPSL